MQTHTKLHDGAERYATQREYQDRMAYTLSDVAALCGRSKTWAYRRVYDGQLKVVVQSGRMLVSRTELERFLNQSEVYNGRSTSKEQEVAR